jgi:UDP-N-acetylmuramoyl-tripeptide--D-alanyl-D-alanine ligase
VEALRRGAAAALLDAGTSTAELGLPSRAPLIEVGDALSGLWRLAEYWRAEVTAEAVAITGSVGKTTTKEFLGILLATRFPTVRAPKSFNNRLGVAHTVLGASRTTRWIVSEIGTSAPGELSVLSRLVRPSRVIITEIGQAHLSGLKDLEGVIQAKAEAFQGLVPGGTAFIQEAVAGRERLVAAARAAGGNVVLFGRERGEYRITACRRLRLGDVDLPAGEIPVGFRFRVKDPFGFEEELILPLPGRHNVLNALGAVAAARDIGIDWAAIRAGVREFCLPPRRFGVSSASGITLIDDTYNASHRSVLVAIEEAGELALAAGGRRFLVLGDLLELGALSEEIHRELGERAARDGAFQGLIAVGKESRPAADAFQAARNGSGQGQIHRLDRVEDAAALLKDLLEPGDLVLFKASHAVGLERAVEETRRALLARPGGRPPVAAKREPETPGTA